MEKQTENSKPIAVLISDVHYNINTLPLADAAMRMAIDKANSLGVQLIVAGDMHDTKANLRGECVNAMLETLGTAKHVPIILVGNHCLINERSSQHSLNFLNNTCLVVSSPVFNVTTHSYLVPYYHDPVALKQFLSDRLPPCSRLIMHQGVMGSHAGDYIQDKSALPKECFADFRVISGHYHRRQDIKCGRPRKGAVGLFSYIGNPFTLNFGEANDPPKGFQVLYDDGTLEFVPTDLRKHIVLEIDYAVLDTQFYAAIPSHDLVWVKIRGTREELATLTKTRVAESIGIIQDFRLEMIPHETGALVAAKSETLTQAELMDSIINNTTNTSDECKERLKSLWKGMV